jgi:hypothetical protein
LYRFWRGRIHFVPARLTTGLADGLGHSFSTASTDIRHHHCRTFPTKANGRGCANARAARRDHGNPLLKASAHHDFSPYVLASACSPSPSGVDLSVIDAAGVLARFQL